MPLVDGGAISAEGRALLLEELREEELSVVLLLGPSTTQQQRRQLVARLLAADPQELGDSSDDALLAYVVDSDQDHPTLVLDADTTPHSALHPLLSVVCALSSLVVTCSTRSSDCETPLTVTLAPFRSLYETLRKELPAIEVFDLLPNTITLEMSSLVPSGSYQPPRGAVNDLLLSQRMKGVLHPSEVIDLATIQTYAPVKKLFGSHLSGESLHSLLTSVLGDLQEQQEPDLATAWDEFAERKCQAVAEDALATYVDCTHASVHEFPPMNLTTFATLHEEIWRLALDVYHSGAKLKSTRRRSVRNRLKVDLRTKYEENQQILRANSHLFCDKLRRSLWQELSPLEAQQQQQQPSFDAVLRAIELFDAEYQTRASGPEKDRVLAEFYHEDAVQAFQRLESLVTEKLSAEHVQDLRERLQQDFETKKQALVEHFKQEEVQLRACMAREMDMMQKVHHAKHARVKIDELEQRRMQTEMAQIQQLNANLKAKQIALEAAHESEVSTNTALERKIEELEGSVRAEMASRAELVDTLALTIKAVKEKDSDWQSQVDLLKLEAKEKSSHIESELKDVTVQLRKTIEVRVLCLLAVTC